MSKSKSLSVRLTPIEFEKFEAFQQYKRWTKTEVIRSALQLLYEKENFEYDDTEENK